MKNAFFVATLAALLLGCEATAPPAVAPPPAAAQGYVNSVGMIFTRIPAGTFRMGASNAFADADEQPVHEVVLSDDFFLGIYEVTQAQWRAVMGENPSFFTGHDERPVERVSWFDVQDFIAALNQREGGVFYRLPTEAEWEYAARARTVTHYYFGDDAGKLDGNAWHLGNAGRTTHPVGLKGANAFGLFDMHGNVWEWIHDWYGGTYYKSSPRENPTGPASGIVRVIRGGSGNDATHSLRAANRGGSNPALSDAFLGFRLVRIEAPAAR